MVEDRAVKVTHISPVWAHIDRKDLVQDSIGYRHEWWEKDQFKRMHRSETWVRMVDRKGFFLAGLVPRVVKLLRGRGYSVALDYDGLPTGPDVKLVSLEGVEYRADQKRALQDILLAGRGVYQAPTGSGKTLLIAGLVASVAGRALVIVHTTALLKQTVSELGRWNKRVGVMGGGEERLEDVTVAMRQTVVRKVRDGVVDDDFMGRWSLVVVDEAHHVNSTKGDYADILKAIAAPVRVGFTATLPTTDGGRLAMEGFLGPVVGRTEYGELEGAGVLAKPKLRFYRVPENPNYKFVRGSYQYVYGVVVVGNRRRNLLIVEKALEQLGAGKSVLIMVERIEHGEALMELLEVKVPGVFTFLYGDMPNDYRREERERAVKDADGNLVEADGRVLKEKFMVTKIARSAAEKMEDAKRAFESKERMGVVATRVWSEGVNIRSVDVVINAVGGESEIAAIQRFGRGLRRAEGKDEVLLIDFIDRNHRWMADHSMSRICTYSEAGWM